MALTLGLRALSKTPLLGLGLVAAAGYVIVRGLSGRCALFDSLGIASLDGWPRRRPDLTVRFIETPDDPGFDLVDEASMLSFPASDPPAH